MAYQSDAIDPGLSPTLAVFNDATVSGHVQGVKLIDGTSGLTTPVGTVANPLWTQSAAVAPSTTFHLAAAGSNNATNLKGTAAQLIAVHVFNLAAYPVYVKIYNKATAPSPGSDTPILTVGVQAGTQRDAIYHQATCNTGLGIAIVKGLADADNTAVLAGDAVLDVEYL